MSDRPVIVRHGEDHRCNGPNPIPVRIHLPIPLFSVGDNKRRFVVDDDLGGTYLRAVHAKVHTVGSTTTTIQVHNVTRSIDVLLVKTTIDASETTSFTAAVDHKMDTSGTPAKNYCALGDVLRVDIDGKGTGANGLEVTLDFGPQIQRLTP